MANMQLLACPRPQQQDADWGSSDNHFAAPQKLGLLGWSQRIAVLRRLHALQSESSSSVVGKAGRLRVRDFGTHKICAN